MRYEIIDADQAPPKPKTPPSKRTELINRIIRDLEPGKVAKIELENGETVRGTKTSLSRAAKKLGVSVSAWQGGDAVFLELSTGAAPRRRGRPPRNAG